MPRALIVSGGWEGHQPTRIAALIADLLTPHGFEVTHADTLDAYITESLNSYQLIVPNWTMGKISAEQLTPLMRAVEGGVGLAGVHGGMNDSFRDATDYQFMTGAQFVAHPGNDGVTYPVYLDGVAHPITAGLPDFTVTSEQYYLHFDPAITVLATTRFGELVMPVAYTKQWGAGRIFYLALGHAPEVLTAPPIPTLLTRGLVWAAGGDVTADSYGFVA